MATVLAPADTASGVEVLLDEVAALLEMVDAFDAVAPLELLPDDLRLLDLDPLLPHYVLPHLKHRHRVIVRVRGIEVVRRQFIEIHALLSPHFSRFLLWCLLSPFLTTSPTPTTTAAAVNVALLLVWAAYSPLSFRAS